MIGKSNAGKKVQRAAVGVSCGTWLLHEWSHKM